MAKKILLWGPSQVGKTALLATALYGGSPELAAIKRYDEKGAIYVHLFDAWLRLHNNRYIPPTSTEDTSVGMGTDTGCEIELIDIRGGRTLELHRIDPLNLLRSADAILFFAEYNSADTGNQMAAIRAALMEVGDKPCALALTKCERYLKYDDEIWDRPAGWLEMIPLWANYARVFSRFRNMVWPTSAFGYEQSQGLPAVIVGEMGQMLPFRIHPLNVAKPLAALLQALDCI